eukprot:3046060-Pleurochrysis_carterae.AAC.2
MHARRPPFQSHMSDSRRALRVRKNTRRPRLRRTAREVDGQLAAIFLRDSIANCLSDWAETFVTEHP